MRVVVTGAAGFVGSHVAEAMADAGHDVLAVDDLTRSEHPAAAERNWAELVERSQITLVDADLVTADLTKLTEVDAIVHLAGRPGVRTSWGSGTAATYRDNVQATRRLLEACGRCPGDERPTVVVASSSSVYGSVSRPCHEDDPRCPESPYARAKAAVEDLAIRMGRRGVPTVILRYFSLYGPRQRPDMAFHRFVEAVLDGVPVPVLGDGGQRRAFTYVADAVRATVRATCTPLPPGVVINVGHPVSVPLRGAIDRIGSIMGCAVRVEHGRTVPGDVACTWASTSRAADLLGWTADTDLAEGLSRQIEWHRGRRGSGRG